MKFPFFPIALFLVIAMSIADSQAQSEIHIRKADFRGQDAGNAVIAALSASEEDVIVVLVRGGSQGLLEKTEGNMKALVRNGYTRLGLIVSDRFPDEEGAVVSIFSSGDAYAKIKNAETDAYNDWAVYNLVKDAYEEDIKPKLPKSHGAKN